MLHVVVVVTVGVVVVAAAAAAAVVVVGGGGGTISTFGKVFFGNIVKQKLKTMPRCEAMIIFRTRHSCFYNQATLSTSPPPPSSAASLR